MRVQFVGHASILVESKGVRILSDPWWKGPCFGAQWWIYPPPAVADVTTRPVEYVYISHGHHDHFHLGTLGTLPQGFRCLVSSEIDVGSALRNRGYDVIEVRPDESFEVAEGVQCRIWPTDGGDTLMIIDDGTEVLINANDALHATSRAIQLQTLRRISMLFPRVDYLFCGYGTASHFPNCYVIPGKDREATALQRQLWFNKQWAWIAATIGPRFAFPFAADIVFMEKELAWLNETIHNAERPSETFAREFPAGSVAVVDIGPGFAIENGKIVNDVRRERVSASELVVQMGGEAERANAYGDVKESLVDELVELLTKNLTNVHQYLAAYPRDYRFIIRLRSLALGIEITKAGDDIAVRKIAIADVAAAMPSYDLRYTTRAHYLRRSLTTSHGHEILFVGSGGIFEYLRREDALLNLHRELITLMKLHDRPVAGRAKGGARRFVKRILGKVIGKRDQDLYDLGLWTVFRT